MTVMITGGSGFIGSNFIHKFISSTNEKIINVDSQSYAACEENNKRFWSNPQYDFRKIDILNYEEIGAILKEEAPRAIIHFAAESHVDRSISDSSPFLKTNVLGTVNLLECVKNHVDWDFKFIHVSTDEVYGSLFPEDSPSTETSTYQPNSPYAASKAASDHFVRAYYQTHKIPTIITNCSNNYGPMQHLEKFIPVVITKILKGEQIPIYGSGLNIRDWIYVADHCEALMCVLETGLAGEKYNIGGDCQLNNLALVRTILRMMNKSDSLISFVEDRKGHDFRYDINSSKIKNELNWKPRTSLEEGLAETIRWYTYENTRNNLSWRQINQTIPSNFSGNKTATSSL